MLAIQFPAELYLPFQHFSATKVLFLSKIVYPYQPFSRFSWISHESTEIYSLFMHFSRFFMSSISGYITFSHLSATKELFSNFMLTHFCNERIVLKIRGSITCIFMIRITFSHESTEIYSHFMHLLVFFYQQLIVFMFEYFSGFNLVDPYPSFSTFRTWVSD
jgi:hypothetical protein